MSICLSSVRCITPSSIVCTRMSGGHAFHTEVRSEEIYAYVSM